MIRDLYHIHSNKWLTGDIWEMRLIGDVYPITAPGQFINVKADGHFLRRPISVCDWDEETAMITIVYKVVGKGTEALSRMQSGQALDVLCGLGNGFDVSKCGKKTLVIGGGKDQIVTGASSVETAEQITGSELYLYRDLGHAAYEEANDFNSRVMTFFHSM